jgi:hypothetical protein
MRADHTYEDGTEHHQGATDSSPGHWNLTVEEHRSRIVGMVQEIREPS